MQKLIAKIRLAAHQERAINREAIELQLYALELCSKIEMFLLPWLKFKLWAKDTFIDPYPKNDESHSWVRYEV